MSDLVKVSQEGSVRRVTMSRPGKANALNLELCHALLLAFHDAAEDPQTHCILLDAEGKVFCAGIDLEEPLPLDDSVHQRLFSIGSRIPKPIVAAVQGPVLAGGVGLIANCQCVVAAMGTSFGLTEMRIGMFPLLLFRALSDAIGARRAMELALTARIFQTDEALRMGLIHAVAPEIELDDRATGLANQIAGFTPQAVRFGMAFAHQQRSLDDDTAARVAFALTAELAQSPDYAEGLQALKEKRRPVWPTLS